MPLKRPFAAGHSGVAARIARWNVRRGGSTALSHLRDFRSARNRPPAQNQSTRVPDAPNAHGDPKVPLVVGRLILVDLFDGGLLLDDGVGLGSQWPAGTSTSVQISG